MNRLREEKKAPIEALTIPVSGLAKFITDLAKRYDISYVRTSNDALADVITKLSDDDVKLDDVVLLLIALERAGIIPSENVVPLHANYLREKLNVRSPDDSAA